MKDKEIIKALECCITDNKKCNCEDCPYKEKVIGFCFDELNKDAIDLINRLKGDAIHYRRKAQNQKQELSRLNAEIEKLTINMNAFGLGMKREKERADQIKAEAIKEYKEKLREHAYLDSGITGFQEMVVDLSDIENIAEEMVGEGK